MKRETQIKKLIKDSTGRSKKYQWKLIEKGWLYKYLRAFTQNSIFEVTISFYYHIFCRKLLLRRKLGDTWGRFDLQESK